MISQKCGSQIACSRTTNGSEKKRDGKDLETRDNRNTPHQNLWAAAQPSSEGRSVHTPATRKKDA